MKTLMVKNIVAGSLLLTLSAGCSTWNKLDNTEKGAVIGTGTGAVVGGAASDSALGAVVGGAAGGVGGGLIGNEMDKDDRRRRRY